MHILESVLLRYSLFVYLILYVEHKTKFVYFVINTRKQSLVNNSNLLGLMPITTPKYKNLFFEASTDAGSYTRVSTVLNVCFLISSACENYYIRGKYNVTHFVKTSSAVAEIIAFFLQFRRLFRLNLTISTCIVLILDSEDSEE